MSVEKGAPELAFKRVARFPVTRGARYCAAAHRLRQDFKDLDPPEPATMIVRLVHSAKRNHHTFINAMVWSDCFRSLQDKICNVGTEGNTRRIAAPRVCFHYIIPRYSYRGIAVEGYAKVCVVNRSNKWVRITRLFGLCTLCLRLS